MVTWRNTGLRGLLEGELTLEIISQDRRPHWKILEVETVTSYVISVFWEKVKVEQVNHFPCK